MSPMRIPFVIACLAGAAAIAQVHIAGRASLHGTATISTSQDAPFNILTFTSDAFAPSTSLLTGFPTVSGHPAQGYQGGIYYTNSAYPGGESLIIPWQYGVTYPHGTFIGYIGGPGGTFHCTSAGVCASNWEWFNAETLSLPCPATYTCPAGAAAQAFVGNVIADNNGNFYPVPSIAGTRAGAAFVRYNGQGLTNVANWTGFLAPTPGTAAAYLGSLYGWCGGWFDGRYVYYAPTSAAGSTQNTWLVRYDTTLPFQLSSFSAINLASGPGGASSCCYESAAYDGQQKAYLIPDVSLMLTVLDTTVSGFSTGSLKVLNMANLGRAGYPQLTGKAHPNSIQTNGAYIGGQPVWDPAGANEYLYFAPFGTNPGGTHQSTILLSTVLRVKIATCGSPTPGAQYCATGFTVIDITAPSATWEMYDLANLAANPAWAAAGFPQPPVFSSGALIHQLAIGGFQGTWLNVHNPADPMAGLVADYSGFFVRHHVSHALSDSSGWDVGQRPGAQSNGCMGIAYDPAHQTGVIPCPTEPPGFSLIRIVGL